MIFCELYSDFQCYYSKVLFSTHEVEMIFYAFNFCFHGKVPNINTHKCFIQNEKLKNYPKISFHSILSKFKLIISSTNGAFLKCTFVLIACIELKIFDSIFKSFFRFPFCNLIQNFCVIFAWKCCFHFKHNL